MDVQSEIHNIAQAGDPARPAAPRAAREPTGR